MLKLTRFPGQDVEILINGQVGIVRILQVIGDKIVLGFDGPPEMIFHRPENGPYQPPEGKVINPSKYIAPSEHEKALDRIYDEGYDEGYEQGFTKGVVEGTLVATGYLKEKP